MPSGKIHQADGSVYVGEVSDTGSYRSGNTIHRQGIPSGRGRVTFSATSQFTYYEGEFLDGYHHGHGTLALKDGSVHVGMYSYGKKHGRGKLTWSDRSEYEGEFRNGAMDGSGIFRFANGCCFEGRFQDNHALEADAIWTERDGTKYDVMLQERIALGPLSLKGDSAFKHKRRRGAAEVAPVEQPINLTYIKQRQQMEKEAAQEIGMLEEQRSMRDYQEALRNVKFNAGDPCVVPIDCLAKWTNNFSPDNKVGEGAFGEVFVAHCPLVGRLAVKRLHANIWMMGTEEDKSMALMCARREVNVLAAFRHPNIIRLIGFTEVKDKAAVLSSMNLCLVYEFASRGGLDSNLRCDNGLTALTWQTRVRIATGLSRALNYLHCYDTQAPAYHRDVKSANVTLTAELVPKLIDCGLAKYHDGSRRVGTIVTAAGDRLGTPGYRCPTYERSGIYQAKSEIFSFGMVLLELITGRMQADGDLYGTYIDEEGDLQAAADKRAGIWGPECLESLVRLARECLERHSRRLETMEVVMERLAGLEAQHAPLSREEEWLLVEAAALRSELEALRAHSWSDSETARKPAAAGGRTICQVCFLRVPAGEDMVQCSADGSHSLCKVCFAHETLTQLSVEERGAFWSNGARLVCRMCKPPRTAYPDTLVAWAVGDAVFALYRNAGMEAAAAAACQEQESRFQEKLAALRAETGGDGEVRRHVDHVVQHVLTDGCPRCKQAFVDFDGCFALTCHRCGCGFCAYCLADCGQDAHRHVVHCKGNVAPDQGVFGSAVSFERVRRMRREEALRAYLDGKVGGGSQRKAVLSGLRRSLEELKMTPEAFV